MSLAVRALLSCVWHVRVLKSVALQACLRAVSPLTRAHSLARTRRQVWRLFTNFFFFGLFTIDFLFHMYFMVRYCRLLEEGSFRGKTADLVFLLVFGGTLMTVRWLAKWSAQMHGCTSWCCGGGGGGGRGDGAAAGGGGCVGLAATGVAPAVVAGDGGGGGGGGGASDYVVCVCDMAW